MSRCHHPSPVKIKTEYDARRSLFLLVEDRSDGVEHTVACAAWCPDCGALALAAPNQPYEWRDPKPTIEPVPPGSSRTVLHDAIRRARNYAILSEEGEFAGIPAKETEECLRRAIHLLADAIEVLDRTCARKDDHLVKWPNGETGPTRVTP
jgi:hypothetical protein